MKQVRTWQVARACVARVGLALAWLVAWPILAEAPATNRTPSILLGMSTVLSGPAADLGLSMRSGVLAALAEANRAGGPRRRPLPPIARDDGYEPPPTAPNVRVLVDPPEVAPVVANVAPPPAVTAIPIANESHTPFFGAFSGAGILRRTPPDRYV